MNDKDKKNVDEQEKLLDHLIEYGGRQYIDEELKKYEDLPELEPSKEFDDRMNRMFKEAYKKETRYERLQIGKKVAVIAIAAIGVTSAAAMNIKAVREPVLNFVFKQNGANNKTKVNEQKDDNSKFVFHYIPSKYKLRSKQVSNKQLLYEYTDATDNFLYIKIQQNESYDNYINQSNQDNYTELHIDGKKYYFLSGDQNTLLMYKSNNIFSIISTLSQSELLKVAQNIKTSK